MGEAARVCPEAGPSIPRRARPTPGDRVCGDGARFSSSATRPGIRSGVTEVDPRLLPVDPRRAAWLLSLEETLEKLVEVEVDPLLSVEESLGPKLVAVEPRVTARSTVETLEPMAPRVACLLSAEDTLEKLVDVDPRLTAWSPSIEDTLEPMEPRLTAWLLPVEESLEAWLLSRLSLEETLENTALLPDIRSETDFLPPSGSLSRTESPPTVVWSSGARELRTSCRCPSGSICLRSSWTRDSGATGRGTRKPLRSCWKRDAVRSARSEESNAVLRGCASFLST